MMVSPLVLLALVTLPMSGLRWGGITLFDILAIAALGLAILTGASIERVAGRLWGSLGAFVVLALVGTALAAFNTRLPEEHLVEAGRYVIVTLVMVSFAGLVAQSFADNLGLPAWAMLLGTSMSSVVALLQAHAGLPAIGVVYDLGNVHRYTGLAEHPVEMGNLLAIAIAFGLYLAWRQRSVAAAVLTALNIYALQFPASLTAAFAVALAGAIFVWRTRLWLLGLVALCAVCVLFAFGFSSSLFGSRLGGLLADGINYATLNGRLVQNSDALADFDGWSLIAGHGFAGLSNFQTFPIHNTMLAITYHAGIFGLGSQLVMLMLILRAAAFRTLRSGELTLLGMQLAIFLSFYLSGPMLYRRSTWVPILVVALVAAFRQQRPQWRSQPQLVAAGLLR